MRRTLAWLCYGLAVPFIVVGAIGFGMLDAFGDLIRGRG